MAFESVDVGSLRAAISKCQEDLNNNKLDEIMSDLNNNNIWQSDSSSTLRMAIQKMSTSRYTEIQNKLANYSTAAGYIEKYKQLDAENAKLQVDNVGLRLKLYFTEFYNDVVHGLNGKTTTVTRSRRVLDYNVQNQITANSNKIKSNTTEMKKLEQQVAALI